MIKRPFTILGDSCYLQYSISSLHWFSMIYKVRGTKIAIEIASKVDLGGFLGGCWMWLAIFIGGSEWLTQLRMELLKRTMNYVWVIFLNK
jgi:hypothetical protein